MNSTLQPQQYDIRIDGAQRIFELANIKGNQLVLALDKVYKSYTGISALQTAGIELRTPTKQHAHSFN